MHLGLRNKTARKQHLHLGIERFEPVKGLMTARLRHDHVEQHQIDLLRIGLVNLNRVETVFRKQDRIAELLKRVDQKIPDRLMIVDDQNSFRAVRKRFR